jgi:ribosomal-protein-alanine N-acetyltransferase
MTDAPASLVRVEPAGPAHARLLAVLHRLCFRGQRWHRPWRPDEMAGVLAMPAARAWLAVAPSDRDDLTPVGLILLHGVAPDSEILTLGVRPGPWRRLGIGRRLLDTAMQTESAAGFDTLLLEVAADNTAALAFYEANGFGHRGRRRGYYETPGPAQARMDASIMARALDHPPRRCE